MNGIDRIAAMCLLTGGCCAAAAKPPLAVLPINEGSIAQMRQKHPLASVEVNDPVYLRKQQYQGFWLRDVLKELSQGRGSEAGLYVRFRCKDGYLPIMPLARAMEGKGLVAIRDAKAPQGKDWQPLPGSGVASTPAPAYLVWDSPPGGPEEYPWPYQMLAIELISSSEILAGMGSDSTKHGGELFMLHCVKCHAINGVGGTFGPELNSPCSVTEYWNPRLLKQFIKKASSVRTGTKMPDFDSLPEKEIHAIIEYLQSLAGNKKPGSVCP